MYCPPCPKISPHVCLLSPFYQSFLYTEKTSLNQLFPDFPPLKHVSRHLAVLRTDIVLAFLYVSVRLLHIAALLDGASSCFKSLYSTTCLAQKLVYECFHLKRTNKGCKKSKRKLSYPKAALSDLYEIVPLKKKKRKILNVDKRLASVFEISNINMKFLKTRNKQCWLCFCHHVNIFSHSRWNNNNDFVLIGILRLLSLLILRQNSWKI